MTGLKESFSIYTTKADNRSGTLILNRLIYRSKVIKVIKEERREELMSPPKDKSTNMKEEPEKLLSLSLTSQMNSP